MSKIPAVPSRSPVVSHGEPAHAFEAIVRARSAVERHRSLLERARRDLDSLVARSVSAAPESGARWWREPGVLTPEQTQSAANMTDVALERALARYRDRLAVGQPTRRRRRAVRSS